MLDFTTIAGPCIDTASLVGIFTYTVTVTDANGCMDNDIVVVTVNDTVKTVNPYIPNLQVCNFLTPNADNTNDVWNIIDIDYYPDNEVMVMNNHGQVLFQQTAYKNTWNGNGLPDGSYYYLVKINELDKTYKGVLTITSSR
jgi:gliding motility-associated-like protein